MGGLARILFYVAGIYVLYRLFWGKKRAKSAPKPQLNNQDLQYCSLCNSYVSLESACAKRDCPLIHSKE